MDVAGIAIAIAAALAFTSTALFLAVMPLVRTLAGSRDFVVYWATGQQLVHHANPFDPNLMWTVEHSTGFGAPGSFFMRNPPWSLPLAYPLGFFSARVAALPWSLMLLGLLVLSVRILWKMYGQGEKRLDLLAYFFPPALICVVMGQTSLFLLLGLVLFLRLHRTRPFWGGAALWLCTLKPHLFVPFGIVLLVWIVAQRNWRIVAGALSALAASCALTELIDPAAWSEYLHWAARSGISNEYIPCLSVQLRNLIDPQAKWLAFVPVVLGSVWALGYYWRNRNRWDWREQGHLLMLVSLLVAPYCWIYDQSLALPALMVAAWRSATRWQLATLAAMFIVVELQTFLAFWEAHMVYLWVAPAWLAWFLWSRPSSHSAEEPLPLATAAIPTAG
ncbi:MAG TPA: glycosyltransferase 87 family protein [Acidobacteriaceae bacterium]|nr:glycosyltransferase 87 family protein [Acidobacteriaceae bacterium]